MSTRELVDALNELLLAHPAAGEYEVYTSNSDAPGENYGAVYSKPSIKLAPDDREKQVVWID